MAKNKPNGNGANLGFEEKLWQAQFWYGLVLFHISSVELVSYADATSTGTKMPRTNWDDIARFQIMLSPNDVVQRFTDNILPIIQKIQDNILQSHILALLRDILIPKLISGDIRVKL